MSSEICIIFDLDGTLVDSEYLCNQAFIDLIPDLTDTVEALTRRNRGRKLAPILIDIEKRLGHSLPSTFESHYRLRVAELFDAHLKPTPGTPQVLEQLSYPCCVASSAPPEKIRHALNISGLAAFFGGRIFSSYEVGSWKPEPGLFLHVAEALGFRPGQCIVVEDSEPGLLAADAAGMFALHYAPALANPLPNRRAFRTMAELPNLVRAIASAA